MGVFSNKITPPRLIERLGRNAGVLMRMVAVHLELPIWHLVELDDLIEARDLALGDLREDVSVVVAIESGRFLHRHGIRLVLREMKAEAKGLDAVIGLTRGAG
jgi:hypothetical protein